jgi:serine/threonine protein kinase
VAGSDPRWIGDYFIDGELGRGAMGVVYRVRHRDGRGPFALKLLKSETLEDSRALKRFAAEVGSQEALGHCPGIVGVVDSGFAARGPFYVMPLIEGTNLRELLRNQFDPLPEATSLQHIGAVVRALAYAHERGFVHRDVKPENVMVTPEGKVFLTDFGIVRVLGGRDHLTRTGELLGTPMFMAPEQVGLDFGKPGPHTDVYAVGVILYQIICKRSPYEALTSVALMGAILQGEPYPSPASLRPGLNPVWARILDGCLARSPGDRFPNAGALWRELSYALDCPVTAKRSRGRRVLAGLSLLAMLGIAAGLGVKGSQASATSPTPTASQVSTPAPRPSATPSASPTPTPRPVAERLRSVWVSGDEAAFERLAQGLTQLSSAELDLRERYQARVRTRRKWRALLLGTALSERKKLRSKFAKLATNQTDPELELLARGFEALVAVRHDDGVHQSAPFVYFHKGDLPALPELMPYVALIRPPAEALERWPAHVAPGERARVAAWAGDVARCRASLELLPEWERVALGWSLFAFVDPAELKLPGGKRSYWDPRAPDPYRKLADAERALAEGNPYLAALIFDELARTTRGNVKFAGRVTFGHIRCYLALGRADQAARVWAPATKGISADAPLFAEIVGVGIMLAESLSEAGEEQLFAQLQASLPRGAGVFALQSPWTQRLLPQRRPGAAKTRLERLGGTLAEQYARSESGADGAIGLGLARLYRLAKACPDGSGIDYAKDIYPLLDRYVGSARASLLPDATRARLDLVTCRITPPPASLVALAETDEEAAELVFQLRVAAYERDWFAAAERRLLAKQPLPKDAKIGALESRLAGIAKDAGRTATQFPTSDAFRLFRARLLVEEARLAWLYSDDAPVFKGLDRRVTKALGPLLQFDLASDLESALRTLDNPQIELEILLAKLGQARAKVTPTIAQAWTIQATAGGTAAVLFHRARRVVDYDAPVIAAGRARQIENDLRETGSASIARLEFGGETLGLYSVRAARACSAEDFEAAWSSLVAACERQPDLIPWAARVLRGREQASALLSRSDPNSMTLEAVEWASAGKKTLAEAGRALRSAGRLEIGALRSFLTTWALANVEPRGQLLDFLAWQAAFEVHCRAPLTVSARALLLQSGAWFSDKELDRAHASGLPSVMSTRAPKIYRDLNDSHNSNRWAKPRLAKFRRTLAVLQYLKLIEAGIDPAEGADDDWRPDALSLRGQECDWSSVGDWRVSVPEMGLRARALLLKGEEAGGVAAGVRRLFLTRPRSLSGAIRPQLLRVLPMRLAGEQADKVLAGGGAGWETAARQFEAGESWRILAEAGVLSSRSDRFSAFPEPLARTLGSELSRLDPRLGPQPIRDLMRWIGVVGMHGHRVSETVLAILESPVLRKRVDLKNLAYWLEWLAERAVRPSLEAVLSGLSVWAVCRLEVSDRLSKSAIESLRVRYARLHSQTSYLPRSRFGPRYVLLITWPKLLTGVCQGSGFLPAESTAAQALRQLKNLPAWLANEPLLPKVLEAFPEFRQVYQAKLAAEKEGGPGEKDH